MPVYFHTVLNQSVCSRLREGRDLEHASFFLILEPSSQTRYNQIATSLSGFDYENQASNGGKKMGTSRRFASGRFYSLNLDVKLETRSFFARLLTC